MASCDIFVGYIGCGMSISLKLCMYSLFIKGGKLAMYRAHFTVTLDNFV